jgi:class 3 adenylate cyclase
MRQSAEQRRLLAVLVADIVGYSRLMAENEADTFYRVKDFQSSLITPTTQRNHGRVVKWTGDGFIGTFDSAGRRGPRRNRDTIGRCRRRCLGGG